jgi:hypothetical protein
MILTTIEKPVREVKDFVKLVESGDFFKEMDFAIQNSPTATMAVLLFKKYCKLPDLKERFSDLWEKIIDEKIKYGYFTLWVEYDIDLNVKDYHFRLSKNYRAKKMDDTGRVSQYLNIHTGKKFPAFNSDKNILKAQIEAAGGFEKFSGQIFQYNTTSQPYEITPLFSVLGWMKTEADAPRHISASADNSLFGNNIFIMKKGADSSNDNPEEPAPISNTDRVIGALRAAKSVKNSGTNHVLTVDTEDPDLNKVFVKIPIGNDIDLDKFNSVDDKAAKKICTACYCFPQILANPSEGLFGNSGEAIKEAIEYWASTCQFEALKIEKALRLMGVDLQYPVEEIEDESNVEEETITATIPEILSIQSSYKQGLINYESAISMLILILKFTREQAVSLIGPQKNTTPDANQ